MTPEERGVMIKFQGLIEQRNREYEQELKVEIKNYSRL
jgi:hypothetical protein